jgi:hypothetical protein
MDPLPISIQLIDPNYTPVYAHVYTAPRSVERQFQQSKENVRLVVIKDLILLHHWT